MRIKSFSYRDNEWETQQLNLQPVNLIVGQNATGKSRTLYYIDLFVKILTQKRELTWGSKWVIEFEGNSILKYELITKVSGEIGLEKLWINDELKLKRDTKICEIYSYKTKKWEEFSPPVNQLAILSRRDISAFFYIEQILGWANGSFGFRFGNLSVENSKFDLLTTLEEIPKLFRKLSDSSKEKIVQNMKGIGFKISTITSELHGDRSLLFVHEKTIEPIFYYNLSEGMMRSLALLISVEYLISRENPATIIVDDFGEGLDYIRAKELGKLVFDECLKENIQLIATSNDNFLMNVVDIDYWNVLIREGKVVKSLNYQNNKKLFDDFRFTGLSNFDFFASDYIPSHL